MPKLRAGSTEQAGFRVGYSFTYQRSVRIERQLTRNFMQTVTSGGRHDDCFGNAAIIYDGLASMPYGALAIARFSSFHNW
jgi:surface antigen